VTVTLGAKNSCVHQAVGISDGSFNSGIVSPELSTVPSSPQMPNDFAEKVMRTVITE
jgi:hypothetical protein